MPCTRREFVTDCSLAAALALGLPPDVAARLARPATPLADLRVRGRVTSAGRGLARVAVSDGVTSVLTDRDGRYELHTSRDRPFVFCGVPAGHRIPLQPSGTARHFVPLAPDARGEQRADFAFEPLEGGDARHGFLLLADPQTQNAFEMGRFHAETVPALQRTVRELAGLPLFGVGCGDIMYDDLALYPEYERGVRAAGVPFFSVVGNHDLDQDGRTDEASTRTFASRFGPTYFSFDRGEVHYVVLDDVFWHGAGYIGYLPATQLAWLAADLAHVERGRTVVVFLHIPLASTRPARTGERAGANSEMVTNRAALYRLLEPYRAHVLAGHTHEHEHVLEGGVHEHVHGTVCGAWWSGDRCWDGTPNGFGVYEVRGSELRWRYQATGRDAAARMDLHAPGAEPTAPGDLIANVWDWDPAWTVTWSEDGARRGLMSRRRGLDPRCVAEQRGPDRPPRRAWVEPMPTDHLFHAPVSPDAREVTVEATDRWGTTHRATWRRPA